MNTPIKRRGRPASVPNGQKRTVVLSDDSWWRLRLVARGAVPPQTASQVLDSLIRQTLPEPEG